MFLPALPRYTTPVIRFRQIGNEERDKPQFIAHTHTRIGKDTYTALAIFPKSYQLEQIRLNASNIKHGKRSSSQRQKKKTLELGNLYWLLNEAIAGAYKDGKKRSGNPMIIEFIVVAKLLFAARLGVSANYGFLSRCGVDWMKKQPCFFPDDFCTHREQNHLWSITTFSESPSLPSDNAEGKG